MVLTFLTKSSFFVLLKVKSSMISLARARMNEEGGSKKLTEVYLL